MEAKNKKLKGKINLLELSDVERTRVIKQLKQNFQRSLLEARLWKTLLQCEMVTINGQVVFSSDTPLEGFSIHFTLE
ncbi:MAG: hypothetical protein QXR01_02385 [Candidatus Bathyarchaeia archaeon]